MKQRMKEDFVLKKAIAEAILDTEIEVETGKFDRVRKCLEEIRKEEFKGKNRKTLI